MGFECDVQSSPSRMGCGESCEKRQKQEEEAQWTATSERHLRDGRLFTLPLQSRRPIFDVDLFSDDDSMQRNLQPYYELCKAASRLSVTTSCFSTWRKGNRSNGCGKVIPVVPAGGADKTRVFFFDDNMALNGGGSEDQNGICNLRNVTNGQFVDFSEGTNGFVRTEEFDQTIVHSSSSYLATLVQANILDAVANKNYITSILKKYLMPGETALLFCDVNATILMEDTVSGKDVSGVLLSTMFALSEVRPRSKFDFTWESMPVITLEKKTTLKQLVRDISKKDHDYYHSFWTREKCDLFFRELLLWADITWSPNGAALTPDLFWTMCTKYKKDMEVNPTVNGIATSWFDAFQFLSGRGRVVLNSYGLDSLTIVKSTMNDTSPVKWLTINHEIWGERDQQAFSALFSEGSSKAE